MYDNILYFKLCRLFLNTLIHLSRWSHQEKEKCWKFIEKYVRKLFRLRLTEDVLNFILKKGKVSYLRFVCASVDDLMWGIICVHDSLVYPRNCLSNVRNFINRIFFNGKLIVCLWENYYFDVNIIFIHY